MHECFSPAIVFISAVGVCGAQRFDLNPSDRQFCFTVTSVGAVKVPKDSASVVVECHAFASSSLT